MSCMLFKFKLNILININDLYVLIKSFKNYKTYKRKAKVAFYMVKDY